eukprot:480853-Amphidinium_carterae.1
MVYNPRAQKNSRERAVAIFCGKWKMLKLLWVGVSQESEQWQTRIGPCRLCPRRVLGCLGTMKSEEKKHTKATYTKDFPQDGIPK